MFRPARSPARPWWEAGQVDRFYLRQLPPMPRGPYLWLQKLLDAFLREDQRCVAPDELSRYRVLVGTTLLQFPLCALYLVGSLDKADPFQTGVALFCFLGYASTLLVVRKSARLWPPALFLCATLAGAYLAGSLHLRALHIGGHVAGALIPLLAFFLMGVRGGLAFAALMSLNAALLLPLHVAGYDFSSPLVSSSLALSGNLFTATCILGVWGLSAMHSRARDKAQGQLEQTLRSLRESERKLSSVLESTDDIVGSLDPQGRLLTANMAMRRMFTRLYHQELRLGEPLATQAFLERHPEWPERLAQVLRGEPVRMEVIYSLEQGAVALDFLLTAIPGEEGLPEGVTVFGRDMTERRQAEARLSELHRSLLDTSRKAGMAEIATGVLHNVGNALNSVNVSATLVAERLRGSRAVGLLRAGELLQENREALGTFLTEHAKGRLLPDYLLSASRQLVREQEGMLTEVQALLKNVEHIRSVVSMQQQHARFVGQVEEVEVPQLLDDALRLHATSFERLGIHVRREYVPAPPLSVDRHRLLQILVNLLSNAHHALLESPRPDKQLTLRVRPEASQWLRIEVADNGIGIAAENLARLFTQGFTTKKNGHGFGLHASAVAAAEMKGRLTCASVGPGQGATFTIELPLPGEQARA